MIKNAELFVNGKPAYVPPYSATDYKVVTNRFISEDELRDAGISLNSDDQLPDYFNLGTNLLRINLTASEVETLKKIPGVVSVTKEMIDPTIVYPYDGKFNWTIDNFGPLWIPKKGATIQLTPENILLYKRIIFVYENNKWEERGGKIFINGKEATTYTFKMNYYWMMGDNRHRSQDSRYWGFVPEDHVVGSAWMIWMSYEKGIRWNRLFKIIK
jgi:signal peptidase I